MNTQAYSQSRPERIKKSMDSTDQKAAGTAEPAAARNSRKVFIKAYGCQMNVYDSARMADVLAPEGFAETADMADADVVILNTCHIREKAVEKVYSELGRVRELKDARAESGKSTAVVVAGCVAQAEGAEITRRANHVDLVVGPQSYHRLPDLLARAARGGSVIDTDFATDDKFNRLPAPDQKIIRARGVSAFVTVQEGCDKFCTFCVVPYTRGAEVSRPVSQIVGEVRKLAESGVREVTLIGQNVNGYHGVDPGGRTVTLAQLFEHIAAVPGIARIRYTTSHPRDMDESLIAAHRDLPALMPFLHLPVQSGSDAILDAMNRKHTGDEYRGLIEKIRAARPDIALSSDFIVGFPGETDADFEATMQLIRDVGFAGSFTFKYSPRPGTPAADMDGQVDEQVKTERLHALQALLEEQRVAFNRATIGKSFDVLFEKAGKYEGQMVGRSPWLQPVVVQSRDNLTGRIARVSVTGMANYSLAATLLDEEAAAA